MKKRVWPLTLLASLSVVSSVSLAETCTIVEDGGNTRLSQYEFSWEVQGVGHESGSFANGDCWIVGPVTIIDIQPASTNAGGHVRNGSQINPIATSQDPGRQRQGYDSAVTRNTYVPELNISPNLTGNDLAVTSGSIISKLSQSRPNQAPQFLSGAVLTVMENAPPAGAFRPPYIGNNKPILGVVADLDYSVLRNLPAPADPPNLCRLEDQFERVWMEQNSTWTGRSMHPSRNQPDYGREMASVLGEALLSLNLNYRDEDKELLLIRLVQYGIDIYGAASNGQIWPDNGGHNHGRKMPLILAGLALRNQQILEYADAADHFIFQEDRQTFYVSAADVGRPLYSGDGRRRDEYIAADVGIAEWGEKHTINPNRDGRNWDVRYRNIVSSSIIGHVLAAELLGVENLWNHPPLFDYAERYYEIEKNNISNGNNSLNPFEAAMYEAYGAGRTPPRQEPGQQGQTIPRPCGSNPDVPDEDCVFDIPE